jgi:hypothetical protein
MCNVSWLQIIAPEWIHDYQQLTEYLPVIQNGYLDQKYMSATATVRCHLLNVKGTLVIFSALKCLFFFSEEYFLTKDHHAEGERVRVRVRECVYLFLVSYSSKILMFLRKFMPLYDSPPYEFVLYSHYNKKDTIAYTSTATLTGSNLWPWNI